MPIGTLGSLLGRVWKAPPPAPPAVTSRQTTPDANDILVWYMNEPTSSGAIANHGTLGTVGNLDVQYGEPDLQAEGVFTGGAARIHRDAINGWHTANNFSAAPSSLQPAYPITFSAWVCIMNVVGNPLALFVKQYNTGTTWNSPWIAMGTHLNTSSLRPNFYLATGAGTLNTLLSPIPVVEGEWCHLGMTYDGSFQRGFINGEEVAAQAVTGAIAYGPGGPWVVGTGYAATGDRGPYLIQDIRIANVARDAAYFRTVYEQALMRL